MARGIHVGGREDALSSASPLESGTDGGGTESRDAVAHRLLVGWPITACRSFPGPTSMLL